MGLFLRQDENRSELQSKIIADLQEKVRGNSSLEGMHTEPEPQYLANQHETRLAGVIISILVIILIVVIIYVASQR